MNYRAYVFILLSCFFALLLTFSNAQALDLPVDVDLIYIYFDWDSTSCSTDAVDIRKNYSQDIDYPEWTASGNNSPFAYTMEHENPQVKAYFQCSEGGYVWKIDVNSNLTSGFEGLEFMEGQVVFPFQGAVPYGLGTLTAYASLTHISKITYNQFSWSVVRWYDTNGVAHTVNYHIGYTTPHTSYTLLDIPNQPWYFGAAQGAGKKEPWIDYVLDNACDWASGCTNETNAIAAVTVGTFNYFESLGYGYFDMICAGGSSLYYSLTNLMSVGCEYNCEDMSAYIHLLMRSLGGMTQLIRVNEHIIDGKFYYKHYKTINSDNCKNDDWDFHQVDVCNNLISDACGKLGCELIGTNLTKQTYKDSLYWYGTWYYTDPFETIQIF